MENYEELWKVLVSLVTTLRKDGEGVPEGVMEDLRSAKTLIGVYRADPAYVQTASRIEMYLRNVEARLLYVVEEKLGREVAERWLESISEARKKVFEPKPVSASKFVAGLPRGEHWVRVQVTEDTKQHEIEKLAENLDLSCKMQENGYLLIYGDEDKVKALIRRIAEKMGKKKGS